MASGGKRNGAGRPPVGDTKKIPFSLTLAEEAKARLAELSAESGHSQAGIIGWLIMNNKKLPKVLP